MSVIYYIKYRTVIIYNQAVGDLESSGITIQDMMLLAEKDSLL